MIKNTLLFLLAVLSISANNDMSFDNVDKQVIYYTYNFQLNDADKLLQSQIQKNPQNLKYYFLSLGIKSMEIEKSVYDEKPATKRDLKIKMLEETIEYAEAVLVKFENVEETTENKFYLGCIYGYLGRMYGVTGSWMSAFSDGKKGRNLLEEVIEENPDFYDAYLLLGLFNYYADRMGGFLGFVAGVLGFSGDRETGLEYIMKTYNKGALLSDQAELLIIELYSSLEANGFEAIPFLRKFVKRYPNNYHMINWYVRDLVRYDLIEEAKIFIEENKNDVVDPYLKAQVYNELGDYKLSNKFLDEADRRPDYYYERIKEHMKFLRVINCWMLNDDKYKKLSENLNEDYRGIFRSFVENDKLGRQLVLFAVDRAKERLSENAIELLNNPPEIKNKYLDAYLDFNSGVYYYQKNNYEKARKSFERVKFFDKKHFHFSALQYLIDIFERIEMPSAKVKELIEEIDNYEYENLSFWVKDLEKKYKLD